MEKLILTSLSLEDFRQIQEEWFKESIKEILQQYKVKPLEEYLTRQEAADVLKISLPTLDNLTKTKGLKRYQVGRDFRYKRSDIDKAVCEGLQHQRNYDIS